MDPDGWYGNALILDTTNLSPAFLNYNVQDTNFGMGIRNINYGQGTVLFYFAPNWASVSQGGSGPGETAFFVAGGDWSSNSPRGLFAIYADAGGSNLYFGGVEGGDVEIYASAPISWSSNVWHQIGVEYTGGDCEIYLDGALAATGDGVMYVPKRSTWTNGFFIGSDNTGYEQARGAFWGMTMWNEEDGAWYTYAWPGVSNAIVSWQGTQSGFNFGRMMGMGADPGYIAGVTYTTNYSDYTNFWLDIGTSSSTTQAVVTVQNTQSNLTYNILTNSVLDTNLADWGVWQTLTATNSVIVAPTLDIASNTMFLASQLVLITGTNGLPDWWQMLYFGQLGMNSNATYDGQGNTLLYDYQNGLWPNVINFTIQATNKYVSTANAPLQLAIQSGMPFYCAVMLDSTDFSAASWTPYASSNITANLGTTQGLHTVWVGLCGPAPGAQQTWNGICLNLNFTAPILVVTNATNLTIPVLQLGGYANEKLASLTYDLTNGNGAISNQPGYMTGAILDTNGILCTNNAFECLDLVLASGVNTVTLHAADLAGNLTSSNFIFILNYSSKPAPVIQLYWPQDGAQIGGGSFTWRGTVDDPTVALSAQIADNNGDTNVVAGLIERNGNFWVDNIPLYTGTNYLALTATDINSNVTTTNITVVQSAVQVTIAPITDDLYQPTVTVSGTINTNNYTVWVNGVAASQSGTAPSISWTAYGVPLNGTGCAVVQASAIPNTDNSGNGTGPGGGGTNSTLANPGNPPAPDAALSEGEPDRPARLYCSRFSLAWQGQYLSYNSNWNVLTYSNIYRETADWNYTNGGSSLWSSCTAQIAPNGSSDNCHNLAWQYQWDTNGNGIILIGGNTNADGTVTNMSPLLGNNMPPAFIAGTNFPGLNGASVFITNSESPNNYIQASWQSGVTWYKLRTGGRTLPPRQSLHAIAANAAAIAQPIYESASDDWLSNNLITSIIPPQQVTILGQPEGPDGLVWTNLPDGEDLLVDIGTHAVAFYITTPTNANYPPQMLFTGTKVTGLNTTVIVGQRINLTYSPAPGAPAWSNFSWSVPGYAISNYDIVDGILYSNFPTNTSALNFYWVTAGTNQVSCSAVCGGASNTATTTFTVLTPTFTLADLHSAWATNCLENGTQYLGLGDQNNYGAMTYDVFILTNYPSSAHYAGSADITQLINRSATNAFNSYTTGNQYFLDTEPFYTTHAASPNNVPPVSSAVPLPFSDGPSYEEKYSILLQWFTTSVSDQFQDFIMFRPNNGQPASNIYVPLGEITWSWSATNRTVYNFWPPIPLVSTVIRPTVIGSTNFPQWTHVWP
jgi:hypothetical protein